MSDASNNLSYETKAIHAGQEYDQWSNKEIIPPIVTSSTFFQNDPTNLQVNLSFLFSRLLFCPLLTTILSTLYYPGTLLHSIQQSNA